VGGKSKAKIKFYKNVFKNRDKDYNIP